MPNRIAMDLVALVDVGLVVLAAVVAKFLYIALYLEEPQAQEPYLIAGLTGGIITHYVMRARQLYEAPAVLAWRKRTGEVLLAIGLSFLMLIATAYSLKISASYSRAWLLTWLCLSAVAITANRPVMAQLLRWLAATGYTARRIAVVGDGPSRDRILQSLHGISGIWVAGQFSTSSIADLIAMGQRDEIDEVVIGLSSASQQLTTRLMEQLSVLPVDVWLCPAELGMPILTTSQLGALSLLQVQPKPIRDWGYVVKPLVDYVAATVCILFFAPLMLCIAIAIKLDGPGPVFFRQRRHGFNHRIIDIYKFRSMTVAENAERIDQARKNDPRVTRVGKLLRRTSLDELPQLFNVLRGDMSLVGPRPHAIAHNQLYDRLDRYASRHRVKGLRGPTEDPEKMRLRVHMDLHYIENWSLWLDFKILAVTPFVGFIHRNAL
jgi:Undecaprenyl-phosphate glucose phosphotransferase